MKPLATALAALVALTAGAAQQGCLNDCRSLREEAASMKAALAACHAGDTCVVVVPRVGDCTGELGCGFAVRRGAEAYALSEAARIGRESRDCTTCAMVDCVSPASLAASCDAATGRCEVAIVETP